MFAEYLGQLIQSALPTRAEGAAPDDRWGHGLGSGETTARIYMAARLATGFLAPNPGRTFLRLPKMCPPISFSQAVPFHPPTRHRQICRRGCTVGACEDAWRAACDVDDLTIPHYLDRRGEGRP
jgi:hypothetical protein